MQQQFSRTTALVLQQKFVESKQHIMQMLYNLFFFQMIKAEVQDN